MIESEEILPESMTSIVEDKESPTSDTNSDFEIIDEAEDDEVLMSTSDTSVLSTLSHVNLVSPSKGIQRPRAPSSCASLLEDLSDSSSLMYKEVDLSPGLRAYKHTPNNKMNVKLNLIVAFAVTAVIFLGVGNYLGWSENLKHRNQLTATQVTKLKHLQDELVHCMQNQDKADASVDQLKICYQNSDYWKAKFETLFRENSGLKDILENVQKQYWSAGNSNIECPSSTASEEFHKLKLDLIVKQMEHLQLLKTFEEVKFQEKLSKEKLTRLEEENADLKAKLKEEEEDDMVMAATMEEQITRLEKENDKLRARLREQKNAEDVNLILSLEEKVAFLLKENSELKSALKQLQSQMQLTNTEKTDHTLDYPEENYHLDMNSKRGLLKIDDLRQRINQMVMENEDLKKIIARLRWSEIPMTNEAEEIDDSDVTSLQSEVQELRHMLEKEQEETQKWKKLYQEATYEDTNTNDNTQNTFTNWWNSLNLTDLKHIFSGGTIDFSNTLNSILQKAAESNVAVPEEVYNMVNTTREMILDLHKQLVSKWEEVETMEGYDVYSQKLNKKLTQILETSIRKLQQAGEKFAGTQKPLENRLTKLTNKISKINDWLQVKWDDIKQKYGNGNIINSDPGDLFDIPESVEEPNVETDPENENWLLERARQREAQRQDDLLEPGTNWFLKRGKMRQDVKETANGKVKGKKSKGKIENYPKMKSKRK